VPEATEHSCTCSAGLQYDYRERVPDISVQNEFLRKQKEGMKYIYSVFGVRPPGSVVGGYKHFGGIYCL
jgi:hypothetical protein